jgi:hypothetical protein
MMRRRDSRISKMRENKLQKMLRIVSKRSNPTRKLVRRISQIRRLKKLDKSRSRQPDSRNTRIFLNLSGTRRRKITYG